MLSSTEYEISTAQKNIMLKIKIFLALELSEVVFILLINDKMHGWHLNIYEQDKFYAQWSVKSFIT